jgi:hypothetical protein
MSIAQYAKGIAAGLGAAATALQPIYGAAKWYVIIPAAATFFATVAIGNASKTPAEASAALTPGQVVLNAIQEKR